MSCTAEEPGLAETLQESRGTDRGQESQLGSEVYRPTVSNGTNYRIGKKIIIKHTHTHTKPNKMEQSGDWGLFALISSLFMGEKHCSLCTAWGLLSLQQEQPLREQGANRGGKRAIRKVNK